ncbi:hypothetical protein [Zhengella mangrovi]|uniref:hypothetical protein n=1 Tax=Zhengella mangrovi TaxID=1982044 RepID=UPI0013FDB25D|nr:hypothetical protein [Zhengella mangrovi]
MPIARHIAWMIRRLLRLSHCRAVPVILQLACVLLPLSALAGQPVGAGHYVSTHDRLVAATPVLATMPGEEDPADTPDGSPRAALVPAAGMQPARLPGHAAVAFPASFPALHPRTGRRMARGPPVLLLL